MKAELSAFERRMNIFFILMNQKVISRLELARRFSVSDVTIGGDIAALRSFVPISSKMGRYGGVYIVDGYKSERVYLSREEERVIEKIIPLLSKKDKEILQMILSKFALPKV